MEMDEDAFRREMKKFDMLDHLYDRGQRWSWKMCFCLVGFAAFLSGSLAGLDVSAEPPRLDPTNHTVYPHTWCPPANATEAYIYEKPRRTIVSTYEIPHRHCESRPWRNVTWAANSPSFGVLIGGLMCGWMEKLGRRPMLTLGLMGVIFSALFSICAQSVWHFMFGQALLGMSVCWAAISGVCYIIELGIAEKRWLMIIVSSQIFLFGYVLSALSALIFPAWRLQLLALFVLPAFSFFLGVPCFTGVYRESPRWLFSMGHIEKAYDTWIHISEGGKNKFCRRSLRDEADKHQDLAYDEFVSKQLQSTHGLTDQMSLEEQLGLISVQQLAHPDSLTKAFRTFPTSVWYLQIIFLFYALTLGLVSTDRPLSHSLQSLPPTTSTFVFRRQLQAQVHLPAGLMEHPIKIESEGAANVPSVLNLGTPNDDQAQSNSLGESNAIRTSPSGESGHPSGEYGGNGNSSGENGGNEHPSGESGGNEHPSGESGGNEHPSGESGGNANSSSNNGGNVSAENGGNVHPSGENAGGENAGGENGGDDEDGEGILEAMKNSDYPEERYWDYWDDLKQKLVEDMNKIPEEGAKFYNDLSLGGAVGDIVENWEEQWQDDAMKGPHKDEEEYVSGQKVRMGTISWLHEMRQSVFKCVCAETAIIYLLNLFFLFKKKLNLIFLFSLTLNALLNLFSFSVLSKLIQIKLGAKIIQLALLLLLKTHILALLLTHLFNFIQNVPNTIRANFTGHLVALTILQYTFSLLTIHGLYYLSPKLPLLLTAILVPIAGVMVTSSIPDATAEPLHDNLEALQEHFESSGWLDKFMNHPFNRACGRVSKLTGCCHDLSKKCLGIPGQQGRPTDFQSRGREWIKKHWQRARGKEHARWSPLKPESPEDVSLSDSTESQA